MGPEDNPADVEDVFRRSLPAPADHEWPAPGALGSLLIEMLARGRSAWPALPLDPGRVLEHVAATVAPTDRELLQTLRTRHADDLYLACACSAGIPEALVALASRFRSTVEAAAARVEASPAFVDEVCQRLYERLFAADDQQPLRIASYQGRGPLGGWLAIIAQRTALNLIEHEAALERVHRRAGAEELASDLDLELRYLKDKYKHEFESAFVEAMSRLTERERTLLGLKVVSGLTLERIGLIYHVDLSTASRWITAARTHLATLTEEVLGARLGLSRPDLQSLARLVASQLDVSIARLLAPATGMAVDRDGAR